MPADRLVFLHGFTQTHVHWRRGADHLRQALGRSSTLTFVDLPGHGLACDDRDGGIADCGARVTALAGRGTYVGYSLGGRVALGAAVADEGRHIERLVLIGATAGLDDPDDRRARRESDDRLAERIATIGVGAFLDEWLALPLFAGLPDDPAGRQARAANTADGLAYSLRRYGTGEMAPLWDRLAAIEIPVLIIAGAHDHKFALLGDRLAAGLPHSEVRLVAGAGHAAHLERPRAVATEIATWLTALG